VIAGGLVPFVADVTMALLGLGMLLGFARLVIGPTLPDRVVALDLIATLAVGIIAVYTITSGSPIFLQAAIALALLSFLGTVVFAGYLEKRHRGE
jgi:multicomponent Na+:H+ antiporter subunit F